MPKLLVFTPTFGDGPQPATLAAIAALQFDGELVREVSWHNPFPGYDLRNVKLQYQRGRQMVLGGDYDGLLCIEHDMVPPPHAAQTMWNDGAPVVYGVYTLRHNTHMLNLWFKKGDWRKGLSFSFYPELVAQGRRDGRIECAGVGFGCTLIRRHVLEQLDFRDEPDFAPDSPFAWDCLRRGIEQIARFDVPVGHIDGGLVLDPFADGGIVNRVLMLQNASIPIYGKMRELDKDCNYTLPPDVAAELEAAGKATIRNPAYA